MGKDDQPTRIPSVNKNMFDKRGWHAFAAVIKYNEDLTVWASNTHIKGQGGKKYNLLWLLRRDRDGPGGRGDMSMDALPLLDLIAHRKCHSKLYELLYFNLNSLVPDLIKEFPITDYDSEVPTKGYDDEKYTVATDILWAFNDLFNQTSADSLNTELVNIENLITSFPGYPEANSKSYNRYNGWSNNVIERFNLFKLHLMAKDHETSLVTNLTGAITIIDVNPRIAHPLLFQPLVQEMDT